MIDSAQIERDFRRILNSRRSGIEMTKMFDRPSRKINEHYSSLKEDAAKARFRSEYRAIVETKFPVPIGDASSNKSRLIQLMLDHAHSLKEVEEAQEKLNHALGDF
jgi:hypothetical protein